MKALKLCGALMAVSLVATLAGCSASNAADVSAIRASLDQAGEPVRVASRSACTELLFRRPRFTRHPCMKS